jgi:hypothetical protein
MKASMIVIGEQCPFLVIPQHVLQLRKRKEKLSLLMPKRLYIFENSVLTSKKTQPIIITKISWPMLFRKMIAVCSQNYKSPINSLSGKIADTPIVKASRT